MSRIKSLVKITSAGILNCPAEVFLLFLIIITEPAAVIITKSIGESIILWFMKCTADFYDVSVSSSLIIISDTLVLSDIILII
ncbi:MAG: hypothetical protein K2J76_02515 [Oscillospiraceae bacterium]|nr:hypothetical protein [Oscillospiraceae bacterium]